MTRGWWVALLLCAVALHAEVPGADDPDRWRYRLALAEWLVGHGDFPTAMHGAHDGLFDEATSARTMLLASKLDRKLTAGTFQEVLQLVCEYPNEMRAWMILGRMAEQNGKREQARRAYGRFIHLLAKQIYAPEAVQAPLNLLTPNMQVWADAEKEVLVWAETEGMDADSRRTYHAEYGKLVAHPYRYQDLLDVFSEAAMMTGLGKRMLDHYREAQRHQGLIMSSMIEATRSAAGSQILAVGFTDYFLRAGDTGSANRSKHVLDPADWRLRALPYLMAATPREPIERPEEPELFALECQRLQELGQDAAAKQFYGTQRARYPADAPALAAVDRDLGGKSAPDTRRSSALAVSRAGKHADALALLKAARAAHEAWPPEDELEVLCRPLWREDAGQHDPGVALRELLADAGPSGDGAPHRYWERMVAGKRVEAAEVCEHQLEYVPLATVWVLAKSYHLAATGDAAAAAAWYEQARAAVRYTGGRVWLLAELARIAALRGAGTGR